MGSLAENFLMQSLAAGSGAAQRSSGAMMALVAHERLRRIYGSRDA
jgi:hypothetical protein